MDFLSAFFICTEVCAFLGVAFDCGFIRENVKFTLFMLYCVDFLEIFMQFRVKNESKMFDFCGNI